MNFPYYNTLNRFRIAALKDNIESIFYQIVSLFMQQGHFKKSPNASKEVKSTLTRIGREYPKKLEEYLEKEEILQERNSYSKTDQDATFMRMKEEASKKPRANSKADKKPFSADKLYYNEQSDSYTCPMGQSMDYLDTVTPKQQQAFAKQ